MAHLQLFAWRIADSGSTIHPPSIPRFTPLLSLPSLMAQILPRATGSPRFGSPLISIPSLVTSGVHGMASPPSHSRRAGRQAGEQALPRSPGDGIPCQLAMTGNGANRCCTALRCRLPGEYVREIPSCGAARRHSLGRRSAHFHTRDPASPRNWPSHMALRDLVPRHWLPRPFTLVPGICPWQRSRRPRCSRRSRRSR
jgi:hypothetical protein